MKSPVEQIKEEFCSRYGLQPEDIEINVTLWNVPAVETVNQIIEDHANNGNVIHKGEGRNLEDLNYVRSLTLNRHSDPYNLIEGIRAYTKEGVIK